MVIVAARESNVVSTLKGVPAVPCRTKSSGISLRGMRREAPDPAPDAVYDKAKFERLQMSNLMVSFKPGSSLTSTCVDTLTG
jgi:hypothetical protein